MSRLRHVLLLTLSISYMSLLASGCVYRPPVQQGTDLSRFDPHMIHRGMSKSDVRRALGKPLLVNPYTDNREVYVYTFESRHHPIKIRQLLIDFQQGRVSDYRIISK